MQQRKRSYWYYLSPLQDVISPQWISVWNRHTLDKLNPPSTVDAPWAASYSGKCRAIPLRLEIPPNGGCSDDALRSFALRRLALLVGVALPLEKERGGLWEPLVVSFLGAMGVMVKVVGLPQRTNRINTELSYVRTYRASTVVNWSSCENTPMQNRYSPVVMDFVIWLQIQIVRGNHYLLIITNICGLNAGPTGNQLSKIRFKNKTTCWEYAFSYYLFELSQRCTRFRWIYVDLHWYTPNGVILPHFPSRPSLSFRFVRLPFILHAVHTPCKWNQRQAATPNERRDGRIGLSRAYKVGLQSYHENGIVQTPWSD